MPKDRHRNRPRAHNFIDLSGQRFGKLIALRDTGKRSAKRPIWTCKCDCGTEIDVLGKYLRNGDTRSCGCLIKTTGAHNRDLVGGISSSFWTRLKRNAAVKGQPVEISREEAWEVFQAQKSQCAISGIPIAFVVNLRDKGDEQTASLDRITSERGYIVGNVQWVHKRINIMKNNMPQDEFLFWCLQVVKHWRR